MKNIHIFQAVIILALASITLAHDPNFRSTPLVPTFVTAWFSNPDSPQQLPTGQMLNAFEQILKLPYNLIVLGQKPLSLLTASKRLSTNTLFIEVKKTELTSSWYSSFANQLKQKGQKLHLQDRVSQTLRFSRVFLLARASLLEPFESDQMIWIDPNALLNNQIKQITNPANFHTLLETFKHHFFLLSTPKKFQNHFFPYAQKTYFKTNFTTFVGGQIIGCKKDAVATMKQIYEDLLRVIIQFDECLWSEDAILSILADRCPFLVSYLFADDITQTVPPPRLLLEDSLTQFQESKDQIQFYQFWISISQILIVLIGCFLLWEIMKIFSFIRSRQQKIPNQDSAELESSISVNRIENSDSS